MLSLPVVDSSGAPYPRVGLGSVAEPLLRRAGRQLRRSAAAYRVLEANEDGVAGAVAIGRNGAPIHVAEGNRVAGGALLIEVDR